MAIGIGVIQGLVDLESGDPAVIAKRAEELGFASYWAPEHTVMPVGSADSYPGKQEGEDPPEALYRMPDPLIALSRASAVTTKIRLGTGVCLIPERNPLLTAKEVATLDHLSKGRFVFGIGAGWNEPECTVMGGDFAHRWSQTKESILAMKELWKGEGEFHGNYYDFGPVVCKPVPAQRPHPAGLQAGGRGGRRLEPVYDRPRLSRRVTLDAFQVRGGRRARPERHRRHRVLAPGLLPQGERRGRGRESRCRQRLALVDGRRRGVALE
jgi:probable F420-dependent oxidoreductase